MARILFVDDDHSIRQTMPAILQMHGYEVVAAATVAEALSEITARLFDVLIADLNIGQPGDGFTVVSAMRRTQPACHTIILTGYPGFESALEAIRNQVDDYLIKPANVRGLLDSLQRAVENHGQHSAIPRKPIADILEENISVIITEAVEAAKSHPELHKLPLSDEERLDHLPDLLLALVTHLRSEDPNQPPSGKALHIAAKYGETRYKQGYSYSNLLDDRDIVYQAICNTVQANLLGLDLSNLLPDLKRVSEAIDNCLKAALKAYFEAGSKAA